MKLKNIKILSGLTVGVMLATTSCRDDTFSNYWDDSENFTVTLSVCLEDMNTATRDGEDTGPAIGSGSQIDMLVYAVYYDKNKADNNISAENPDWQAATEYVKKYEEGDVPFEGHFTAGHGQSVINVKDYLDVGKPYPITLTLKKGQEYQVVFWAQNHETQAFVIDDLKKVQMKYKVLDEDQQTDGSVKEEMLCINNDEKRDAFTRSISLNGNQTQKDITVYLKRPLAQINVGTFGYDFETITRNADDSKKYLYSKIRINRAARYYNAVEDYTYTTTTEEETYDDPNPSSTEAFYTIDYEYNKIPAYWNMDIPKYPSYTIYDLVDYSTIFHHSGANGITDEEEFKKFYQKEEFLRVHLPDNDEETSTRTQVNYENELDKDYAPYARMGVSGGDETVKSEIFKYLSMCYILTATDDSKGESLTNVKVWMKNEDGDEVEIVNLNNVPVQRNHRTNIVGKLLTAKADLQIIVDEAFAGRKVTGDESVMSGEITEGFYYDADADEFQISSVNGLLFFQQLVNGDLTVRQINGNNSITTGTVGVPYPYYGVDGGTYKLKYTSHKKKSDGGKLSDDIAQIIVKGSKYDELAKGSKSDNGWKISVTPIISNTPEGEKKYWPQNNNFPFYGATVKLMADIDLSGIEWIPIGFDCANWDTTFKNYDNGYKNKYKGSNSKKINYIALTDADGNMEIPLGERRAFCGVFDGNGHTIYNLTLKKFSARVHDEALQDYGSGGKTNEGGPYDNVQWFEKGLFGVVGPRAIIKDLRLQNVNIQGHNGVGGIVGQVSSVGFPAKIQNCIVDGGRIEAVPIYRGDYNQGNFYGRTGARGCYIGGIVGQFVAKDDGDDRAEITGCEVRNVFIQAYRRIGGIVGGIADQGASEMSNVNIQLDIKIDKNNVVNSTIIVNQYKPFNAFWNFMGNADDGSNKDVWMNGFGWGSGADYTPMSDTFIGGYYHTPVELELAGNNVDAFSYGNYYTSKYNNKSDYYDYVNNKAENSVSNLKYTELAVSPDKVNDMSTGSESKKRNAFNRISTIEDISLNYLPMITSLYVDKVILKNNYYGKPQSKTKINFHSKSNIWYQKNFEYSLPMNFPNTWDIDYTGNANTGIYAESVEIDGYDAPGHRSVITPTEVNGENSCVMYITARDRKTFKTQASTLVGYDSQRIATSDQIGDKYKQPTTISNVVLRGSPYAWSGIIIAPNENMNEVNLNNVTVYDVYKTIALEKEKSEIQNYTVWPGNDPQEYSIYLNLTDCNLRGYTDAGEGWSEITYTKTTFEQGSQTKYSFDDMRDQNGNAHENRNEYKTIKVRSKSTFNRCYFKAPYYIDLSEVPEGVKVYFNQCYGSSAYENELIDIEKAKTESKNTESPKDKIQFIEIEKNTELGRTIIRYYKSKTDNKPIVYDGRWHIEEIKND